MQVSPVILILTLRKLRILREAKRRNEILLNEVNFRKPSRINPGCIAILEINDSGEFLVEILNDKWLMEYKRSNFRMLGGETDKLVFPTIFRAGELMHGIQ